MADSVNVDVSLVPLGKFDLSCQTRDCEDKIAISDYATALKYGEELPSGIAVQASDGTLYLAAGFHRHRAHGLAKKQAMPVVIQPGTKFDALRIGVEDNAKQRSVRLSMKDREVATNKLIQEDPAASNRAIAGIVGLSHTKVGKLRKELEATGVGLQSTKRRGRDGREIDVAAIGKPAEGRSRGSKSKALGGHSPRTSSTAENDEQPDDVQQAEPVHAASTMPAAAGHCHPAGEPESLLDVQPTSANATAVDHPGSLSQSSQPSEEDQPLQSKSEVPSTAETPSDSTSAPEHSTQVTDAAKEPLEIQQAEDRCQCGQEWISDGEGGRYCEGCGEDHPTTPSIPYDGQSDCHAQGPQSLQESVPAQGESEAGLDAATPETHGAGEGDGPQEGTAVLTRMEELLAEAHCHLTEIQVRFPGRYIEARRELKSAMTAFRNERSEVG